MDILGRRHDPHGVALSVDGPNVLHDKFDVDLNEVRAVAENEGDIVTYRLYLDKHATPGLIQAAKACMLGVVSTNGDVDVKLSVDTTALSVKGRVATIAISFRGTDLNPV